jgi:hypothetical protein
MTPNKTWVGWEESRMGKKKAGNAKGRKKKEEKKKRSGFLGETKRDRILAWEGGKKN